MQRIKSFFGSLVVVLGLFGLVAFWGSCFWALNASVGDTGVYSENVPCPNWCDVDAPEVVNMREVVNYDELGDIETGYQEVKLKFKSPVVVGNLQNTEVSRIDGLPVDLKSPLQDGVEYVFRAVVPAMHMKWVFYDSYGGGETRAYFDLVGIEYYPKN